MPVYICEKEEPGITSRYEVEASDPFEALLVLRASGSGSRVVKVVEEEVTVEYCCKCLKEDEAEFEKKYRPSLARISETKISKG